MADSKQKITERLYALPFVFVPNQSGSRQNDMVSGIFLSHNDVYWNDSAGVLDEIKEISSQISGVVESLRRKTLCNIYPGLHDFFVNGCGVPETPSFQEYLKILGQFAHYVSPSCAAKAVSYLLKINHFRLVYLLSIFFFAKVSSSCLGLQNFPEVE